MPSLEFFGPSAVDANRRPQGTARLVNCYRAPSPRGPIVRPMPGLRAYKTFSGYFLRAMQPLGPDLYVVQGGRLRRIKEDGTTANLMAVADDSQTDLAGLNGAVVTVAGGAYRVYTATGSARTPEYGAFSYFGSCVVTAQRVLLTERDGRRVQWSNVADPETLDGLSFATAEQRDGDIIRAALVGPEVWLFKETCIERWIADSAGFSALPGGLIDLGLKGFNLLATMPGGVFFIDNQGNARITSGGAPEVISSPEVATHIKAGELRACFVTFLEGRPLLVIAFADRPAWVFDTRSREWFERAEGEESAWNAITGASAWGREFVGMRDGRVMEPVAGADDAGEPLIRRMVSATVQTERRFRVPMLRLQGEVGTAMVDDTAPGFVPALQVGSSTALQVDGSTVLQVADAAVPRTAEVMLRLSRDHGRTWGPWLTRSLGDGGAYDQRLTWRALGQFDALTAEVRVSEPLDVSLDATAMLTVA